jgi:hypothetical protein
MKKTTNITRLLVLAGTVILATDQGSLAAGRNAAVVAQAGDAPQKILVEANSSFAFDLYAQLSDPRSQERRSPLPRAHAQSIRPGRLSFSKSNELFY